MAWQRAAPSAPCRPPVASPCAAALQRPPRPPCGSQTSTRPASRTKRHLFHRCVQLRANGVATSPDTDSGDDWWPAVLCFLCVQRMHTRWSLDQPRNQTQHNHRPPQKLEFSADVKSTYEALKAAGELPKWGAALEMVPARRNILPGELRQVRCAVPSEPVDPVAALCPVDSKCHQLVGQLLPTRASGCLQTNQCNTVYSHTDPVQLLRRTP